MMEVPTQPASNTPASTAQGAGLPSSNNNQTVTHDANSSAVKFEISAELPCSAELSSPAEESRPQKIILSPPVQSLEAVKRKQYPPERLLQALEAVKNGSPLRGTSREMGVPKSTLQDLLTKGHQVKRPRSHLSYNDERIIVDWTQEMYRQGYPTTRDNIMMAVKELLDKQNIVSKYFVDNKPGKNWWVGFRRRHKDVRVKGQKIKHEDLASIFDSDDVNNNRYADVKPDPTKNPSSSSAGITSPTNMVTTPPFNMASPSPSMVSSSPNMVSSSPNMGSSPPNMVNSPPNMGSSPPNLVTINTSQLMLGQPSHPDDKSSSSASSSLSAHPGQASSQQQQVPFLPPSGVDDCDLYGQMVSMELKRFSEYKKDVAKKRINELLMEIKWSHPDVVGHPTQGSSNTANTYSNHNPP